MPFNVSGVFSRLYNWVADRDNGIKIMAARMDGEADDVAAALNAIVSQSQPFINPIMAPNGTAGLPAYSFDGDTNTGLYRPAADQIGFSTGGTQRALLSTTAFAVNLPISGTAVTQSETDTTAGRLTKVGDFGIGGSAVNLTSAQTFEAAENTTHVLGNDSAASVPTDAPTSGNAHVGLSLRSASARGMQMMAAITGGSKALFWRAKDTTYSAWAKVYDSLNILGTVSQSGGIPTGAIMERGSNANGEFVRFADGTQICTHIISGGATSTAAGSIFTSGDETWTFPRAFTSATGLTVAASVISAGRWCNVYGTTSSDATIRQFNSSSNAATPNIRVVAIGRWF